MWVTESLLGCVRFIHGFIHDSKHGISAISNHSILLLSMKEHISRPRSAKERWAIRRAHIRSPTLFHVPRHDIPSDDYRQMREAAMHKWREIARVKLLHEQQQKGANLGAQPLSLQCPK
jgi:hypothetical protein